MAYRANLGLTRDANGFAWMRGQLYVPELLEHLGIRHHILHGCTNQDSRSAGSMKIYHDVCRLYWWPGLKKDMFDVLVKMSCLSTSEIRAHETWRDTSTIIAS